MSTNGKEKGVAAATTTPNTKTNARVNYTPENSAQSENKSAVTRGVE